ncbi:helix-turn-helix transcriptional regulator [Xanthocytophaga agilis]|uniref:Helix-turn-helix transcriptional regulator n=1 Tax=Xanthocytophaga agilis TaxID=3048010 RepID=A0AAE3R398_9BACT|nr:helix-turn-helix transcriptional regulator [Xanthocytophaga agilis]MDJ1499882.1 helix-turn-helix transcriptional regulator [Xanthocytophaga agilis]
MNDVIKAIMDMKNLTPSRFADEIGVPRPIISHILAGRNKPSLDMIQKIARRFPELGTEWILDETKLPIGISEITASIEKTSSAQTNPINPLSANPFIPLLTNTITENTITEEPPVSIPSVTIPSQAAVSPINNTKKIEKILVFYTDKTFEEYTPNH